MPRNLQTGHLRRYLRGRGVRLLLALCSLLLLASCSRPLEPQEPTEVEYRGETLYCVGFGNAYGASASCDYDRFYAEHPELLAR